eukprot:129063-Prymnesium_polylepis.2
MKYCTPRAACRSVKFVGSYGLSAMDPGAEPVRRPGLRQCRRSRTKQGTARVAPALTVARLPVAAASALVALLALYWIGLEIANLAVVGHAAAWVDAEAQSCLHVVRRKVDLREAAVEGVETRIVWRVCRPVGEFKIKPQWARSQKHLAHTHEADAPTSAKVGTVSTKI